MSAPSVINPALSKALTAPFQAGKCYLPVVRCNGTTQKVDYVEWIPGTIPSLDSTTIVQSLPANSDGLGLPMSSVPTVKPIVDAINLAGGASAVNRWPQRVYTATAISTLINSAVETSIVPAGLGSLTIPAGVFDVSGYAFRFEACGTYTNTLTGTITLKIKIGASISLTLTSLALPNLTGKQWYARGLGTVRAARLVNSFSVFSSESGLGTFDDSSFAASDVTIAAGPAITDFTAKWAVAAVGSSFTVNQLYLELIPPTA